LKDNKETRNDLNDLKAYYYHKDGMNSVTSLTDEQANEKEKYIYNAFGKMTVYDERDRKIASSQIGNPYSFTGREHDSETGLHYHRARYYSPELARWINEDPIEFNSGDMNLYRYVENNPLSWIDPIGTVRRRPPKRFTQLVKPKSSVKYLPVRETRAPDVTKYVRHRCYGPQANLCYPEPEPEPEPKPEPVPCTPENPTGDPKKAKPNKFNFYLYFNPNSSPSL
ncbi:MAG: RHS repeat-associated core domain-containing protein, partial [Oligoflexia bacterium]|nr:RHS repeat-associated core domain-containing protein [Oligoflexia bacterium]